MPGRKAYPYVVMKDSNDKNRLTKEQLEARAENEPYLQSAELKCPRHLSKEAKKEWKRIVNLYEQLNKPVINDLDVNALELYCEALITYRKAMQKVKDSTEVYTDKASGQARVNPWLNVAYKASDKIKKYGEILLLDPVSRARVGLAKARQLLEEEEDPMARLLKNV